MDQFPAGDTIHRVFGKTNSGDVYDELHVFSGDTEFGDELNYEFETTIENIRYIRIETTESPSFVSWSEIEIYGLL